MTNSTENKPLTIDRLLPAVVGISLPALYFSRAMPFWIPPLAVGQLIFIFLLRYAMTGQMLGRPILDWLVGALLLLALVSLGVTTSLAVTLHQVYAFIANLAIFAAVAVQKQNDARWLHWSAWGLLATAVALALLLSFGTVSVWYRLPVVGEISLRVLPEAWLRFQFVPGYNPNMTGGVLALFWLPALVLAWRGSSWLQRDLAKLTVVILTGPILLAEPRGAWIGIVVALLTITLLQSRRWLLLWIAALATAGLGIFLAGPTALLSRALGPGDTVGVNSMLQRWALWQQAEAIIAAHPIMGMGLGVIKAQRLIGPEMANNHAHNLYLQITAETGLLGLGIHLVFFGTLFYLLIRRVRRQPADHEQALALGLLGSLIVFLTHGLVEVITYYAWWVTPLLWALFGLMAAVGRDSNQTPR